jgi:hypothetical protein
MSVDTALRVYATVTGPTAIFTTLEGVDEPFSATAGEDIRQVIVQRAATEARRAASAVELVTSGDHGEHRILVDSDGGIHRAKSAELVIEVPQVTEASEGKEVGTQAQEQGARTG